LAEWVSAFLNSTFSKMESLSHGHEGANAGLSLHDPLCVWYLLVKDHPEYAMTLSPPRDIRVETAGQWTRGMCLVDGRDRKELDEDEEDGVLEEIKSDHGGWLSRGRGNRIRVAVGSPGMSVFGEKMLGMIFGV
jgi:inosine-uridine nucleoside N-ribohydrolase